MKWSRVIYWSRAVGDPCLIARRIAPASVNNNKREGITGVLLVLDDGFLQVIEGPAPAISLTMARITADVRHTGLKVLRNEALTERNFSDFVLLKLQSEARHQALLTELRAALAKDAGTAGPEALQLLHRVRTDTV